MQGFNFAKFLTSFIDSSIISSKYKISFSLFVIKSFSFFAKNSKSFIDCSINTTYFRFDCLKNCERTRLLILLYLYAMTPLEERLDEDENN